jgi:hypothetical protein
MLSVSGFSQKIESSDSIKSYTWTNSLAYLPSVYGESEIYKYKNGRLQHRYSKTKAIWRLRWNSKKIFTTKNKEKVSESYGTFLEMSGKEVFKIGLLKQDKDSLIAMSRRKDFLGFPLHSADYNDLKKYITKTDTIEIEIQEFNTDYSKTMDAMTGVIDGAPFWINLEIVVQKNDTIKYEYVGNLYDGVEDTSVDEFLTFYYIYQDYKLFKYTPMDKYFERENLYKVILRYIAYKENKVDRENYLRLGY